MATKIKFIHCFCAFLLTSFWISGCDAWSSRPDPPATEIKDVRVDPNPVEVGATTTFTVVTPDSAQAGFRYKWLVPSGGAETASPRYEWTAAVEPGEYVFSVLIVREGAYEEVSKTFPVTVVVGS